MTRTPLGPRPRFGPIDKLLTWLAAIVLLGGCAPAATGVLNRSLGDEAQLVFAVDQTTPCGEIEATGLCFAPGSETALGVSIDIIAEAITELDARCETETYGATCQIGDVNAPTLVTLTGQHVTATAAYRRDGSNRIYQEAARH